MTSNRAVTPLMAQDHILSFELARSMHEDLFLPHFFLESESRTLRYLNCHLFFPSDYSFDWSI